MSEEEKSTTTPESEQIQDNDPLFVPSFTTPEDQRVPTAEEQSFSAAVELLTQRDPQVTGITQRWNTQQWNPQLGMFVTVNGETEIFILDGYDGESHEFLLRTTTANRVINVPVSEVSPYYL